jgi:tetratricopeptide (TPR) repeat protein
MSRFVNLEMGDESEHHAEPPAVLKDESYYLHEARTAFESARFEQALRGFAKVLEFNSQNAAAWTGQVRALIELGEFREAKLWADKALERFPREPELLAAKAVALGRIGDVDAALAFSDAAIEERGDTPYIWLARGDVLLARREARADYCFEKALFLASVDWFFHWLAARILAYYEQFARALKCAQKALALDAGRSVVWHQAGLCQLALGLDTQAQVSLEQARQLDPQLQEVAAALDQLGSRGFLDRLRGRWRGLFSP